MRTAWFVLFFLALAGIIFAVIKHDWIGIAGMVLVLVTATLRILRF